MGVGVGEKRDEWPLQKWEAREDRLVRVGNGVANAGVMMMVMMISLVLKTFFFFLLLW